MKLKRHYLIASVALTAVILFLIFKVERKTHHELDDKMIFHESVEVTEMPIKNALGDQYIKVGDGIRDITKDYMLSFPVPPEDVGSIEKYSGDAYLYTDPYRRNDGDAYFKLVFENGRLMKIDRVSK